MFSTICNCVVLLQTLILLGVGSIFHQLNVQRPLVGCSAANMDKIRSSWEADVGSPIEEVDWKERRRSPPHYPVRSSAREMQQKRLRQHTHNTSIQDIKRNKHFQVCTTNAQTLTHISGSRFLQGMYQKSRFFWSKISRELDKILADSLYLGPKACTVSWVFKRSFPFQLHKHIFYR